MANIKNFSTNTLESKRSYFIDFINQQNKVTIFLILLFIVVCSYDLLSPPISVTINRQTQTAMLVNNFVKEGFSLKGLYLGLSGHGKIMMVYEFPIYNFIVGLLFKFFNNNPFWGKIISFLGAIITLVIFQRLVKSISNNLIAFCAALFFIFLPVNVLMFTSFQPDAIGLMFLMLSLFVLNKWRENSDFILIIGYSISLLLCGLCKYPLLVPYIPISVMMYLFPRGKFRIPRVIELLTVMVLFIIPLACWYLYRGQLTDPMFLSYEFKMFLIGNLKRFLSPGFYMRPAIMLLMLVTCGSGIIYFFSGLRRISIAELVLIIGIPFYYIIVPTVASQYYYLYAITPIVALFMAKGVNHVGLYCKKHHIIFLSYALGISFVLFALFGITYVLRMDSVILSASKALRQVSQPEDLIFVVNMHDRGTSVGGLNPSVFYFADRNGWNINNFDPNNFENTIVQIDSRRNEGARWLFVSWYTPSLEPWYSIFLPEQFKRSLSFDSKAIADKLKQRYPAVRNGDNFSILKLNENKSISSGGLALYQSDYVVVDSGGIIRNYDANEANF